MSNQPMFCPHEPTEKQREFLESGTLEALFGGGFGAGKSEALLMAALQHVDDPGYHAIIFRKEYEDLVVPGGILDRARGWLLSYPGVVFHEESLTFRFPSGASLSFGYLDLPNAHLKWLASEFQFIGFDELKDIRENHYRYLFSRLRKPATSSLPLRIWSSSYPSDNWVRARFIEDNSEERSFVNASYAHNPHIDKRWCDYVTEELAQSTIGRLRYGDWYS